MKLTIKTPNDPETLDEWQTAVDAADALLKLDAARLYGLVSSGPDVDAERCWEVIHRAAEEHGIEPAEDAVERFVAGMTGGRG